MIQEQQTSTAVTSADIQKVTSALESPDFVWRTTEGLAKDTHLPESTIVVALHQIPDDVLVTTSSRQGRLYTTRRHWNQKQSFFGKLVSAAAGKIK